jgi:hypothetical protein
MSKNNRIGMVVRVNGTIEQVEIEGLECLQTLVEGYIEAAPLLPELRSKLTIYCNEEGRLKGLDYNENCNRWLKEKGHDMCGWGIVGDVVFIGGTNEEGEDTDLSEATRVELVGMVTNGS